MSKLYREVYYSTAQYSMKQESNNEKKGKIQVSPISVAPQKVILVYDAWLFSDPGKFQ